MALRATNSNVIIKPIEDERVTATGLYLPDQAIKTPTRGEAISVGSDVTGIEVGDTVLFEAWSGAAIQHDGQELFAMPAGNILAVLG